MFVSVHVLFSIFPGKDFHPQMSVLPRERTVRRFLSSGEDKKWRFYLSETSIYQMALAA